jgi:hypothetical protein
MNTLSPEASTSWLQQAFARCGKLRFLVLAPLALPPEGDTCPYLVEAMTAGTRTGT